MVRAAACSRGRGVIYDALAAGGLPGALLGVGAGDSTPAANAIAASALASGLALVAGDYWLGMDSNDTSGASGCDSGGGTSGVTRGALLNIGTAGAYTNPVNPAGTPAATYQTLLNFDAWT